MLIVADYNFFFFYIVTNGMFRIEFWKDFEKN